MTDPTPLDLAHEAMAAAPEDVSARLKYFERLADSELFLLLTEEAQGERLSPEVFDLADGSFVLVFDREDRLAGFVGRPAPYAALSGRMIAAMLAGQGMGMALNPDVAPSSNVIDPAAVAWLADTVGVAPDTVEARVTEVLPPKGIPEALLTALDQKLATATGLAHCAYLVGVAYDSGARGHMLALIDAVEAAQGALAKAVNEALTFSGIEAGALDIGFFTASDPMAARMARHGLRFDLPQPEAPQVHTPQAPGMDPEKPPKLR